LTEYKYRYWDEANKIMVYFTLGELLAAYNDEGDYPAIAETDLFRIRNDIDTKKVMDYVLTNKQGCEIYEGDIVFYPPFNAKGTVTPMDNSYIITSLDKTCTYSLHDEYELIGNMYELVEGA